MGKSKSNKPEKRRMDERPEKFERQNEEYRLMKRRVEVAEMYLSGHSQVQIAEKMDVSVNTVAKDLHEIRRVWVSRMEAVFEERKAQELAKIDRLEQVAWEAYERSRGKCRSVRTRNERIRQSVPGRGGRTGTARMVPMKEVKEETVKDREEGDPRFLEQVSWCIETRLRLMGLLKGETTNNNTVFIDWAGMVMKGATVKQREGTFKSTPGGENVAKRVEYVENEPANGEIGQNGGDDLAGESSISPQRGSEVEEEDPIERRIMEEERRRMVRVDLPNGKGGG